MTFLAHFLLTVISPLHAFADMRSTDFAIVDDSLAGEQSASAGSSVDRIIQVGQGFVVENWILVLIIGLLLIFFSILGIVRKRSM